MSSSYSKDLARFLSNTFLIVREAEGPCSRLTLKHVAKGSNDVATYNIGESDKVTEDFLQDLQRHIETDAQVDSTGLGGVQKYQLLSFHVNTSDKPLARFSFREGDPSNEEDDFNTEPANEKGLVAQCMRHTEALMRSQVTASNNMLSVFSKSLEKLQAEKERLMDDRFRNMETMERLMSASHERAMIEKQIEHEHTMKADMGKKLLMLAPAVVNKLMGKPVLPEAIRPQDMMLKAFAESITEEQFIGLQQLLKPEQLATVAVLLESTQKDESEKTANGK